MMNAGLRRGTEQAISLTHVHPAYRQPLDAMILKRNYEIVVLQQQLAKVEERAAELRLAIHQAEQSKELYRELQARIR